MPPTKLRDATDAFPVGTYDCSAAGLPLRWKIEVRRAPRRHLDGELRLETGHGQCTDGCLVARFVDAVLLSSSRPATRSSSTPLAASIARKRSTGASTLRTSWRAGAQEPGGDGIVPLGAFCEFSSATLTSRCLASCGWRPDHPWNLRRVSPHPY
jgi:hypothetical protein